MPVTFHIPGALREFTAGKSRVQIEKSPATLAEALSALWILYPGVRDRIATEQGQVREHINIFIGDENVRYTGGLASPVPAGCEISIVPAVSGGRASASSGELAQIAVLADRGSIRDQHTQSVVTPNRAEPGKEPAFRRRNSE
jgi:molybdopterin synthase sulfur carrier subunit